MLATIEVSYFLIARRTLECSAHTCCLNQRSRAASPEMLFVFESSNIKVLALARAPA